MSSLLLGACASILLGVASCGSLIDPTTPVSELTRLHKGEEWELGKDGLLVMV